MKLYELSQHYALALDALRDADEQTRMDTLEGLGIEDGFKEKALAVAGYFQSLDAESEALKEAAKRIQARQKAIDSHSASLKAYLLHNMVKTNITSIKCPEFEIKLAKCPASVLVDDIDLLPDSLVRVKKEADKVAIKRFIEEFGALDGAHIEDGKVRLSIK